MESEGSAEKLGEKFSLIQDDLEKVENGLQNFQGGVELYARSLLKCAKSQAATFEHLKQENEHLKAENEKLRRENKQLRTRLPKYTMPTETTTATLKVEEYCLRMEFATKTGELATCFKGAFQLFYGHLRSKLNKKIESSVKKLEEDVSTCLEKLKEIDDIMANYNQEEAHSTNPDSDSDSDSDSSLENKDQIKLEKAKEECTKMIEELRTSFEEYKKLFSAEDMQPVSRTLTVTGTDVGRVECKDFLLKIDEMCRELAECKRFFEKLHDAVTFTQKQKKKFRLIHRFIKLHEMHMQRSEVNCVQESGEHVPRSAAGIYTDVPRGDDFDDMVDTIDCFRAVSKELSEGSNRWHKSMEYDLDLTKPSSEERVGGSGGNDAPVFGNEENFRKLHVSTDKHVDDDPGMPQGTVSNSDSPQEILERFKDSFREKVMAKAISGRLCMHHVIPEEVKTTIEQSASNSKAAEVLYDHLKTQADYCSLTTMIVTISETQGYHQMSNFGKDLKTCLESKNKLCTCPSHSKK